MIHVYCVIVPLRGYVQKALLWYSPLFFLLSNSPEQMNIQHAHSNGSCCFPVAHQAAYQFPIFPELVPSESSDADRLELRDRVLHDLPQVKALKSIEALPAFPLGF